MSSKSFKSFKSFKGMSVSEEGPGDGRMKTAYKLSSAMFKDRLASESAADTEVMQAITDGDVVVVDGCYDHIHLVLEGSVPFDRVSPRQVAAAQLRPGQVVYVNCGSDFPREGALTLERFVRAGGMLITTDWALKNVLEVGFPGYVEFSGEETGDEVVGIEVGEAGRRDEVVRGFLDEASAPQWWLEGSSYPIRVLDADRVTTLIRSEELGERFGADAVVVHFKHGEGEVYHVLSHLYLQRSEAREKKQAGASAAYACAKGASAATRAAAAEADGGPRGLSFGQLQSANTSYEMVSRAMLKQKRKSAAPSLRRVAE